MEHSMKIMQPLLGDDHVTWDPADEKSVTTAKEKFDAAVKKGGKAFKVVYESVRKTGEQIKEFDPSLKEILIVPQLAGG